MEQINVYEAIKMMRKLSADNFPFSFSFISCDRSRKTSSGLVVVEHGILSKGLPKNKSKHANNLVAYENISSGEKKHFWLPLLMSFNNIKISHDRVFRG